MLLTTKEIAALLKVHPKHVYRLLKRGLPAHRVGDEWRFDADEVRRYCRERGDTAGAPSSRGHDGGRPPIPPGPAGYDGGRPPIPPGPAGPRLISAAAPPLLAANDDVAIELLLDELRRRGAPLVGHVQADHATGLSLLARGAVLLTGCHCDCMAAQTEAIGRARIHLAQREVGLVFRRGLRLRGVSGIVGRRLAYRPATAGIRAHLDSALLRAGVELERAYAEGELYPNHRDVVMAVLRDDSDVGLASRAWATSAGLGFLPLASEAYDLVLRADDLGDPRVVALCEVTQSAGYRKRLRGDFGYETRRAGEIRVGGSW
jgi:excisionase family DNA binding protein